jgi:hypothetical protein
MRSSSGSHSGGLAGDQRAIHLTGPAACSGGLPDERATELNGNVESELF